MINEYRCNHCNKFKEGFPPHENPMLCDPCFEEVEWSTEKKSYVPRVNP